MTRIHRAHGGHDAIKIRLAGGRNLQEGMVNDIKKSFVICV